MVRQNIAATSLKMLWKNLYSVKCYDKLNINEPRSDKRGLLTIKVKSEVLTKKERPSYCELLQKI